MAIPVITPGGPLVKRGKATQSFTATGGVDAWTCERASDGQPVTGTFSNDDADSADWEAPNISEVYLVKATNADGFDSVTVTVTAVVPFVPDKEFEPTDDRNVLVFKPDVGQRQTVVLGDNSKFDFIRNTARKIEKEEMHQFWQDNYPGRLVYFTIPDEGESLWEIDSGFKRRYRGANLWAYSFSLLRAS